jgi:protocatechuate 3,4-dioxygenase beta subunit
MRATPADPSRPGLPRRDILRAAVAASALGVATWRGVSTAAEALMIATPANALGPFYPARKPADSDADLTMVNGRTQRASGTILYVSGRVFALDGRPLPNVELELWQANAAGRYDHPGDRESSGALDPNFQGYARLLTDADGRYRIKTIKPAPYSGRTPHLHFNVASGRTRLTTQMFFEGEPANERDGLFRSLSREDRIASTARPADRGSGMEQDAIVNVWDIVLRV